MDLWTKIKGKRSYIQGMLMSATSLLFCLDTMLHDDPTTPVFETKFLAMATYLAIGAFLGGGSIVTLRAAMPEKK